MQAKTKKVIGYRDITKNKTKVTDQKNTNGTVIHFRTIFQCSMGRYV